MSFYKNLVSGKYNTYEKVASADEDVVKNAISELSTEQLNALAEEFDIFAKEASEITLESSLFEEDEYISYEIGEETSEGLEAEASEEETQEEVAEEEAQEEKTQEEVTKEETSEELEAEAGEEEAQEETVEEETSEELEAEASEEDEFEIVKEACEQVGEYLVENDLTIADYVYSLTGLEKHASHIGEMAEKVAMVYDIPVVMAARDLVSTMMSLVEEE